MLRMGNTSFIDPFIVICCCDKNINFANNHENILKSGYDFIDRNKL